MYRINEIFYSIQGEGGRAGQPSIFVRLSGCNLKCSRDSPDEGGFDCDTEFVSGVSYTKQMLIESLSRHPCKWVVLTGGEPSLQVDQDLVDVLHEHGYKIAIETNGTNLLPNGIDWVTVSPKTAEHTIRVKSATEVKYVRQIGQGIPKPSCQSTYRFISPAFDGTILSKDTLAYCIQLVLDNPDWALSVQQHKLWRVR